MSHIFKANVPLLHFILINMAALLPMRRHDKRWEKSKLSYCKVKTFASCRPLNKIDLFVGNKAIGSISKRRWQENKAPHVLQKTNISYPLIHTRTCWDRGKGGGGKICLLFEKFGVLFFFLCYLRFEIRHFALLPTYFLFYNIKTYSPPYPSLHQKPSIYKAEWNTEVSFHKN